MVILSLNFPRATETVETLCQLLPKVCLSRLEARGVVNKAVLLTCAGKARGFGFAGFVSRAHAERAIKLANGQVRDQ